MYSFTVSAVVCPLLTSSKENVRRMPSAPPIFTASRVSFRFVTDGSFFIMSEAAAAWDSAVFPAAISPVTRICI